MKKKVHVLLSNCLIMDNKGRRILLPVLRVTGDMKRWWNLIFCVQVCKKNFKYLIFF